MPRKSEQEWAIIENEYIHSPVTYDNLSKKYNINIRAICVRAMKNKWEFKRKADIQRTTKIVVDSQVEHKANEDIGLINNVNKILALKTKAEIKLLEKALASKDDEYLSKVLGFALNKSKDSITELGKLVELLKGNATDRLDFQEQDTEARNTRLNVLGFVNN